MALRRLGVHASVAAAHASAAAAAAYRSGTATRHGRRLGVSRIDFFGVVTSLDESVVEFFPIRAEAEAFIAEVDADASPS